MGRKIIIDPKKVMSFTSSKEPATLEQLAEVEKNIMNVLNRLEEEYSSKGGRKSKAIGKKKAKK